MEKTAAGFVFSDASVYPDCHRRLLVWLNEERRPGKKMCFRKLGPKPMAVVSSVVAFPAHFEEAMYCTVPLGLGSKYYLAD